MSTRLVHPEAAGLSDSVDALWRDVRKATTGNFTTAAALEKADDALAHLLNSGQTQLRLLRQRIRAEREALEAAERSKGKAA